MNTIYCDSSLEEACYVIKGQEPTIVSYPEKVTVNVGEYQAVILALKEAKRLKLKQVMLLTDSQLTANQINGLWKCRKEHLLTLLEQARTLLKGLKGEISWISREDNLAGKVLE